MKIDPPIMKSCAERLRRLARRLEITWEKLPPVPDRLLHPEEFAEHQKRRREILESAEDQAALLVLTAWEAGALRGGNDNVFKYAHGKIKKGYFLDRIPGDGTLYDICEHWLLPLGIPSFPNTLDRARINGGVRELPIDFEPSLVDTFRLFARLVDYGLTPPWKRKSNDWSKQLIDILGADALDSVEEVTSKLSGKTRQLWDLASSSADGFSIDDHAEAFGYLKSLDGPEKKFRNLWLPLNKRIKKFGIWVHQRGRRIVIEAWS